MVLLREHWADVLRVIAGALIASVSTIFTVWALAYATSDAVGMSRSSMLWVGALANLVALAAIPLWATLSDRIGRRPVFLIGAAGSAVTMFLYLWAISTGNYPLTLLLGIVAFGVVYSAANGVWPSFYGEMFSTRVRLSGMAIGTQIGFAVAGFAVTFAAQIAGPDGDRLVLGGPVHRGPVRPAGDRRPDGPRDPQGPHGGPRLPHAPGGAPPGEGDGLTLPFRSPHVEPPGALPAPGARACPVLGAYAFDQPRVHSTSRYPSGSSTVTPHSFQYGFGDSTRLPPWASRRATRSSGTGPST